MNSDRAFIVTVKLNYISIEMNIIGSLQRSCIRLDPAGRCLARFGPSVKGGPFKPSLRARCLPALIERFERGAPR